MQLSMDPRKPLRDYYPIIEECLLMDVSYLATAADDEDSQRAISRLIVILRVYHCGTIGDVLNIKQNTLKNMNNLGPKGSQLLFKLLGRISAEPECMMDMEELKKIRRLESIKHRLRELGLTL